MCPTKNKRNNNYFQNINNDDINDDLSLNDGENTKIVAFGYFDRKNTNFGATSQANTTLRYNENKVANSVEFPKLNKTNYTETLYSLKSQNNASPHDRIMKTLEKKNKKKNKNNSMSENENNVRSQELAIYKEVNPKQQPLKDVRQGRNNLTNQKKFYEITTIEEDDESFSSTNYRNIGLGKKRGIERYKHINSDLDKVIPPEKSNKSQYYKDEKYINKRGLSVRNCNTIATIETTNDMNHYKKKKGSLTRSGYDSPDNENIKNKSSK